MFCTGDTHIHPHPRTCTHISITVTPTGAVPRILVHAPSVAVSWTAYELAKTLLAGAKQ